MSQYDLARAGGHRDVVARDVLTGCEAGRLHPVQACGRCREAKPKRSRATGHDRTASKDLRQIDATRRSGMHAAQSAAMRLRRRRLDLRGLRLAHRGRLRVAGSAPSPPRRTHTARC